MTKIKCLKCGQELEGDNKGTFIQCKCKHKPTYIDEYGYCRIGYENSMLVMVFDEEKHKYVLLKDYMNTKKGGDNNAKQK